MKIRLFIFSILIFLNSTLNGITTGLSLLRHPKTGKRIAILFDTHFFQAAARNLPGYPSLEQLMPILTPHNQEHENLIDALGNNNESTAWISECEGMSQYHIKNANCENDLSTLLLAPKAAYARGKTNNERLYFINNLALRPYDPRHPFDIWTGVSFVFDFKKYYELYKNGSSPELNAMTIDAYTAYIQETITYAFNVIESLDFCTTSYKNLLKLNFQHLAQNYQNSINEACTKHSLIPSYHVLEIYKKELGALNAPDGDITKISKDAKIPLIFSFSRDFALALFDIGYLREVMNIPLQRILIQTGGLHAKLLEHRLINLGFSLEQTFGDAALMNVNQQTEYVSNSPEKLVDGIRQINPVEQVDKKVLSFFGYTA